jgi:hypothetical protein
MHAPQLTGEACQKFGRYDVLPSFSYALSRAMTTTKLATNPKRKTERDDQTSSTISPCIHHRFLIFL